MDGGSARSKAATYTQNNIDTETSMPLVGFEPTIAAFERAKIVHALDRAATMIGSNNNNNNNNTLLQGIGNMPALAFALLSETNITITVFCIYIFTFHRLRSVSCRGYLYALRSESQKII
jgi:hypothetical protein